MPNHDDAWGATGLGLVLLFCVTAANDHDLFLILQFQGSEVQNVLY